MGKLKRLMSIPVELYHSKALIWNLSKNDFKTKFAGSYLGIIWAFIQPMITIVVYWFVFQMGFRSGNVGDYPFVLWLIAGLVPWFFFSEALTGGTNALIEYNYLVKKVVFKISILPMVKMISALFVHLFFICFALIIFGLCSFWPTVYTLQIVYYSFCMIVFTLALSYITCSVVVFFRDLTQIINIILQVGIWVTPIMWQEEQMFQKMPAFLVYIFKLNPLYYIVKGYRDALINKVWFFQHWQQTIYFWVVTIALFVLGQVVFKRLKVHFADVL